MKIIWSHLTVNHTSGYTIHIAATPPSHLKPSFPITMYLEFPKNNANKLDFHILLITVTMLHPWVLERGRVTLCSCIQKQGSSNPLYCTHINISLKRKISPCFRRLADWQKLLYHFFPISPSKGYICYLKAREFVRGKVNKTHILEKIIILFKGNIPGHQITTSLSNLIPAI